MPGKHRYRDSRQSEQITEAIGLATPGVCRTAGEPDQLGLEEKLPGRLKSCLGRINRAKGQVAPSAAFAIWTRSFSMFRLHTSCQPARCDLTRLRLA